MVDYTFCLENYIICDDHYLAVATEGAKLTEFVDRAKNFVRKLILQINMFIAEKINKIEKLLYYKPWWQAMTELTKSKVVSLATADSTDFSDHYWFNKSSFPKRINDAYDKWTEYMKMKVEGKSDDDGGTLLLSGKQKNSDGSTYRAIYGINYDPIKNTDFIVIPISGVKKILAQFVTLLKNIHNALTKYNPNIGGDTTANKIGDLYHKSHDVNQVFQLFMQGTNRAIAMSRKMKYNDDLRAAKKIKEKKKKAGDNDNSASEPSDD